MNHILGLKTPRPGDDGRTRGASLIAGLQFLHDLPAARAVNRPVDPSAAQQSGIRRVHDGIDPLQRDISKGEL
ncbi:hypothetical protein D3C83_90420 [compost metagenome]